MKIKVLKACHNTIFVLVFLMTPVITWSQNDTLVLKNNDVIVGEIKLMDQALISIKTPYSKKDFSIKWRELKRISTEQTFVIQLSKGERFNSIVMSKKDEDGKALLFNGTTPIVVEIKDIVYLKPLNSTFISKFRFSNFSVGYSYTKSNNLSQLTINSKIYYTTFKWLLTGQYNSVISNQTDVPETKRIDANINMKRFMKKDWFYSSEIAFLTNDEQKLDLRTTFSGGFGTYLLHSNFMIAAAGAGLAYTNESYNDDLGTVKNSLEAYLALAFNVYDFKDLTLTTNGTLFPSLTENKRYRVDLNISLKYDLPFDFYINLSATYNYDSQPVEGASSDDYVYQTTFGWEFK